MHGATIKIIQSLLVCVECTVKSETVKIIGLLKFKLGNTHSHLFGVNVSDM